MNWSSCCLSVVDCWFMNCSIRPSKLVFGGGYGLKEGWVGYIGKPGGFCGLENFWLNGGFNWDDRFDHENSG